MNIFLPFVIFLVGLGLVVKCGDLFVDSAGWLSTAIGIPPFIVGATIVSLATTLPELLVSLIAAVNGQSDMAIGNAVGSVTANTGIIMAVAFLFMTIKIDPKVYIVQFIMLVLAGVTLWLGTDTGALENWAAIVLIVIFISFMAVNVNAAKNNKSAEKREILYRKDILFNVTIFILAAVGIIVGSQLLVNGGSALAVIFKVPERIIAVTLVSIGTSMPELVTTVTAIRKKQSQLSIGNIIGANIIDLSLILPICSFASNGGLTASAMFTKVDMPACIIIILIALVPLAVRGKATKLQGAIMLGAYAVYLFITI